MRQFEGELEHIDLKHCPNSSVFLLAKTLKMKNKWSHWFVNCF